MLDSNIKIVIASCDTWLAAARDPILKFLTWESVFEIRSIKDTKVLSAASVLEQTAVPLTIYMCSGTNAMHIISVSDHLSVMSLPSKCSNTVYRMNPCQACTWGLFLSRKQPESSSASKWAALCLCCLAHKEPVHLQVKHVYSRLMPGDVRLSGVKIGVVAYTNCEVSFPVWAWKMLIHLDMAVEV